MRRLLSRINRFDFENGVALLLVGFKTVQAYNGGISAFLSLYLCLAGLAADYKQEIIYNISDENIKLRSSPLTLVSTVVPLLLQVITASKQLPRDTTEWGYVALVQCVYISLYIITKKQISIEQCLNIWSSLCSAFCHVVQPGRGNQAQQSGDKSSRKKSPQLFVLNININILLYQIFFGALGIAICISSHQVLKTYYHQTIASNIEKDVCSHTICLQEQKLRCNKLVSRRSGFVGNHESQNSSQRRLHQKVLRCEQTDANLQFISQPSSYLSIMQPSKSQWCTSKGQSLFGSPQSAAKTNKNDLIEYPDYKPECSQSIITHSDVSGAGVPNEGPACGDVSTIPTLDSYKNKGITDSLIILQELVIISFTLGTTAMLHRFITRHLSSSFSPGDTILLIQGLTLSITTTTTIVLRTMFRLVLIPLTTTPTHPSLCALPLPASIRAALAFCPETLQHYATAYLHFLHQTTSITFSPISILLSLLICCIGYWATILAMAHQTTRHTQGPKGLGCPKGTPVCTQCTNQPFEFQSGCTECNLVHIAPLVKGRAWWVRVWYGVLCAGGVVVVIPPAAWVLLNVAVNRRRWGLLVYWVCVLCAILRVVHVAKNGRWAWARGPRAHLIFRKSFHVLILLISLPCIIPLNRNSAIPQTLTHLFTYDPSFLAVSLAIALAALGVCELIRLTHYLPTSPTSPTLEPIPPYSVTKAPCSLTNAPQCTPSPPLETHPTCEPAPSKANPHPIAPLQGAGMELLGREVFGLDQGCGGWQDAKRVDQPQDQQESQSIVSPCASTTRPSPLCNVPKLPAHASNVTASLVYRVADAIHAFMTQFIDHRDSGVLLVTHFTLLLGLSIPIWLFAPTWHATQAQGVQWSWQSTQTIPGLSARDANCTWWQRAARGGEDHDHAHSCAQHDQTVLWMRHYDGNTGIAGACVDVLGQTITPLINTWAYVSYPPTCSQPEATTNTSTTLYVAGTMCDSHNSYGIIEGHNTHHNGEGSDHTTNANRDTKSTLESAPPPPPVPLLAGIAFLGFGDTLAAVVGSTFGVVRVFRDGHKTVVGAGWGLAGMLVVYGVFGVCGWIDVRGGWWGVVGGCVVGSLVELCTKEVDNVLVPLVMVVTML